MAKGETMTSNSSTNTNFTKEAPKKELTREEKKEINIKTLRYQRDKDREKVRGIFKFYEVPGGSMSFVFRVYKDDQVERFDLVDGETYTIPLGVAKHLNKNGYYPLHSYAVDETGKPMMKIGQKVRRFGFQSLEFTEIEDLEAPSKLVTVENVI